MPTRCAIDAVLLRNSLKIYIFEERDRCEFFYATQTSTTTNDGRSEIL